jgi:O-acetyl-ADP-ribose deacetylase (regulator of RNase III)
MKQLKGNLLDLAEQGQFDIIVHGCNCFHAMRSGIAAEIARRYPEAEQVDSQTEHGSRKKLGHFSYAFVERKDKHPFYIVNAYTQYKWSGYTDVFEYQDFDTVLNRLVPYLHQLHKLKGDTVNIGFPKIGCGLARGDESRIVPMIENFAKSISPWATVALVTLH